MQRKPMVSKKLGDKFIVSRRYENNEKELLPLSRGVSHFFDIDDDKRTYRVASRFLMVYVVK